MIPISKISKIKNPELRHLIYKMDFTSNVIQRMEQYYKQHYK